MHQLYCFLKRVKRSERRTGNSRQSAPGLSLYHRRLTCEPLEDRHLLSVALVTNTLDSGLGSLRQAIIDANAATAPVTISFNIPATDPGFVDDDATLLGGDPEAGRVCDQAALVLAGD